MQNVWQFIQLSANPLKWGLKEPVNPQTVETWWEKWRFCCSMHSLKEGPSLLSAPQHLTLFHYYGCGKWELQCLEVVLAFPRSLFPLNLHVAFCAQWKSFNFHQVWKLTHDLTCSCSFCQFQMKKKIKKSVQCLLNQRRPMLCASLDVGQRRAVSLYQWWNANRHMTLPLRQRQTIALRPESKKTLSGPLLCAPCSRKSLFQCSSMYRFSSPTLSNMLLIQTVPITLYQLMQRKSQIIL